MAKLLTLEECRDPLGESGKSLTDAEVLAMRDEFDAAARVFLRVCHEREQAKRLAHVERKESDESAG